MHKPRWQRDYGSRYERYTWESWVVYKDEISVGYTVYDKRKFGDEYIEFETIEHAQQYAETMEAVGA